MSSRGFVSLVGAGPGHPDYLTVKAVRRLQEAELVLHDALVSDEVCAIAASALRINVGKRGRRKLRPHGQGLSNENAQQREIERLMIEAAQQGLKVVRLKGGDPFVFGRGGEEALALQRAGIPFEVVPGVTTAIGAPTLAGIPVTHRDVSPGFVVLTGSDLESVDRVLSSIAPGSLTVVVLMGIGARRAVANCMIARGWALETPAAIVRGAATAEMWTWRGSLSSLRSLELPESNAPGTIVVGAVAALPIELTNEKGMEHVRA